MVQTYVEIAMNVSLSIRCIKFRQMFYESFNKTSSIRRRETIPTVISLVFGKWISKKKKKNHFECH